MCNREESFGVSFSAMFAEEFLNWQSLTSMPPKRTRPASCAATGCPRVAFVGLLLLPVMLLPGVTPVQELR
jgi:hypothetical protein